MTETDHKKREFAVRFVGFGIVMVIANVIPYFVTRGAHATDRHEMAGFPFHFYDIGGMAGLMSFNVLALMANIAIALAVAAGGALLFRGGIVSTLRRWQTWGTPNAR